MSESAEGTPVPNTHRAMNTGLSGHPVEMAPGRAVLAMTTTEAMRADEHGLVHGGFVFSLADHAAMLAIDHPNVVIGKAEVKFLRPVVVGDALRAEAELDREEGKKQFVGVRVLRGDEAVLEGELLCFSPEKHVLDR